MTPGSAEPSGSEDPFAVEALRESVLRTWLGSPTRLREDTNAEEDLRLGAYRDRLLVELAQNAADAAVAADVEGHLRITLVDGELRFANTGAPLDARGVAGLASLRASPKREGAVGRFGVGFAAVLGVTDEPRIVSTSGGVGFSARRSRDLLAEHGAGVDGDVAVLRMPWPLDPVEPGPPQGYTTEVRLPVREGVDTAEVLRRIAEQVPDVLLALPALSVIEVDGRQFGRAVTGDGVVELTSPDGTVWRWFTRTGGESECVWAMPVGVDGEPRPMADDLLHAPTPTDERLSLPARLIAALPLEPSRRRVRPGPELTEALGEAARGYVELVRGVPPGDRLALVPPPGFPRSDVDATLRELVSRVLAERRWLPAAEEGELTAGEARVFDVDAPRLVRLVSGVVRGLVSARLCGPESVRLLTPLGAERLGIAGVVDELAGLSAEHRWWLDCYDELQRLLDARAITADALAGLPVPLADGRTVVGPRDVLEPRIDAGVLELLGEAGVLGLRILDPDTTHPLLRRLGARQAGAAELLSEPALLDAVHRSVEDALAGTDVTALARLVLRLVAETTAPPDLGALALPGRGGWRRADELVLPASPLLELFDADVFGAESPLDVLDEDFAERVDSDALRRLGVLDDFAIIEREEPTGPEHDLPDEAQWWQQLSRLPDRLLAVRDLDLVADEAWPAALRLLAAHPRGWAALTEKDGHAGWWIARNAVLAGRAPGEWRMPWAGELAGLYDPLPDLDIEEGTARAAGVRTTLPPGDDPEDAADLLGRLAEPGREVPFALTRRAHSALAASNVDLDTLPSPGRVRVLTGEVVDAAQAAVLDAPWLLAVWPPHRLVASDRRDEAEALADVLDLPLAGELTTTEVDSTGEYLTWAQLPAVTIVAGLLGASLPERGWPGVVLHERLIVTGAASDRDVLWWVDRRLHAQDSPQGLARAFAWASDRWQERHLIAALLEDPEPATLLG